MSLCVCVCVHEDEISVHALKFTIVFAGQAVPNVSR